MEKTLNADELKALAVKTCERECEQWRWDNKDLISQMIEAGRWLELTNLFFKKGFSTGMKFNREMRAALNKAS